MDPIKHDLDETSWIIQGNLPHNIIYDFNELWNLHPVEYGKVKIMGKIIDTPRWQQTYLKNYWYTGMTHDALPLPAAFRPFYDWANTLDYGNFNQVLINWYQDGSHYIGKHSDNENQLVPNSPIMSISLGGTRIFRIRSKSTNEIVKDISMSNNTYIIMGGSMQKNYFHEVTKTSKHCAPRINITMRIFK